MIGMSHSMMWGGKKQAGGEFFFDTVGFEPVILFANRKLTSKAGDKAFDLRPATGGQNSYLGTVLFNQDGTLTADSTIVDGPWSNLGESNGLVLGLWEQMGGSFIRSNNQLSNNSSGFSFDLNGHLYFQPGTGNFAQRFDIPFEIPQPFTVLACAHFRNDGNFKQPWTLRQSDETTIGGHFNQRGTAFGTSGFGTNRTITHDLTTEHHVVSYIANSVNGGNIYVDNIAKNPANLGSNSIVEDSIFRFITSMQYWTCWAIFDFELSTSQISELVTELKNYIEL